MVFSFGGLKGQSIGRGWHNDDVGVTTGLAGFALHAGGTGLACGTG
jgi:hypothetical protein